MIDINVPITPNDLNHEFLRKLYVLGKTYGNNGDYEEVKDFITYAFSLAKEISPSDTEYEPFNNED